MHQPARKLVVKSSKSGTPEPNGADAGGCQQNFTAVIGDG
jgi:hypothetical protein